MDVIFPFLNERPYFYTPQGAIGWVFLVLWIVVIVILQRHWLKFNAQFSGYRRWLLLGLAIAQVLFSIGFGIWLPSFGALPLPKIPIVPQGPALMFFSAVPWFLGAGYLGPLYSGILALISGFIQGYYSTHNPYLILELALLGTLLGAFLRQRYRTTFFSLLRHPLFSVVILTAVFSIIFILNSAVLSSGSIVARLDYALSNVRSMLLSIGGSLLVAGITTEVIMLFRVKDWGGSGPLIAAPAERSLQARFFYTLIPIGLIVVLILIVGDWWVSGNAAKQMLEDRMTTAVGTSIESVPFFLEAGQDLIQQISDDPRLYTSTSGDLQNVLRENLRRVPFFRQLYYLDTQGNTLAGYPDGEYDLLSAPIDEQNGIDLAKNGVKIQSYAIPPEEGMKAAQVSFISNVQDGQGQPYGVLVGRIDLESNPFTQPIIANLDSLIDVEGQGFLLDENRRVLYHPIPELIMSEYQGDVGSEESFSDQTAPDGTRSLVYFEQAIGRPWAAAMWVPAQQGQQLSLEFAAPLLVMILVLAILTIFLARFGIRSVTTSLQNLAVEADRIAQGELDHPLSVEGDDEVGQLRRSFEQMRVSLKARLDELNQLLVVSQGVASSLDLDESMKPVLDAALSNNVSSAHIVLDPKSFEEVSLNTGALTINYRAGSTSENYGYLDSQVLDLARNQEQIVLTNPTRVRVLQFESNRNSPQAMAVFPLRHESQYYGAFWIAYNKPHVFTDEEIKFYKVLSSHAAVAAANSNLFMSAEVGKQRLEAILESTPDPILVTDSLNQLLYINPAALKAFGDSLTLIRGQVITSSQLNEKLLALLSSDTLGRQSAEISLPDERTYLAIASTTLMNGQPAGRVCVMRDITQFKELDALRTEFVSTVSHDLRSPLTLIHGYATMLQMVGELNEQQAGYTSKILVGIDNMNKLVNNLLDLGRIDAGVGLQLELVPIRDIVEQVTGSLHHPAVQKKIILTAQIPENVEPVVEADPALLKQALHNLVENAIKYTDTGGEVEVGVNTRGEIVQFYVKDTGIGIAPVDQARLFEKFYRVARRGSSSPRGTGLGLAIVKSIAVRHGGRVWLESQLGRGSVFYFQIPLRQSRPFDGQNSK